MSKPTSFEAVKSMLGEPWMPHTVARFNGHTAKITRFMGVFGNHRHDTGDELFVVLEGSIQMRMKSGTHVLNAGDTIVVPKGEPHEPSSIAGAVVMTIELLGMEPTFID